MIYPDAGIPKSTGTAWGSAVTYEDIVGLWTDCVGYTKSDGTCDTPEGTGYPGAGIPNSTGEAWGTSFTIDADLSTVSASDDTIPSAKATKTALNLKVTGPGAVTDGATMCFDGVGGYTSKACTSITIGKSSGVAGDFGLYEANSTDTHAAGFRGPASITGDGAYRIQFPNAKAGVGQVLSVTSAGESGTGTAADPYVQAGSWVTPLKATDTHFLSFVIAAPAATDDINILKAPVALTITGINCIVQGTTSVTGQIQECSATGGDCADLDSDIVCDADGAADDGTLTDSAIAANAWIRWKTTSVDGTPTFLTVTVKYTR